MPSVDKIQRIADYFGVSVDYLLGRDSNGASKCDIVDVTGLTAEQIDCLRFLADELRGR